jgi:hypothetical protein
VLFQCDSQISRLKIEMCLNRLWNLISKLTINKRNDQRSNNIITTQIFRRFNSANPEVLQRTGSIWFYPPVILRPHLPKIYHNVTFPSFAGLPNKGFPIDFQVETL